jgi:hypothetical protein
VLLCKTLVLVNCDWKVICMVDIFYQWPCSPFCCALPAFSASLIPYTVGRTPWKGDQPVARQVRTHSTTQTQTSLPRVGFKPTTPVFERAKTVHASDLAAALIDHSLSARHMCVCFRTVVESFIAETHLLSHPNHLVVNLIHTQILSW